MPLIQLYRNKGYGYLLFHEIIKKARDESIDEFFSMVDKNNVPSNKIMKKNGGKVFKENEKYFYYKFW